MELSASHQRCGSANNRARRPNTGNLAAVHIKLEEFGSAILDADNAIKVDPKYIKAYYRKGSAYIGLGKYKQVCA